MIAPTSADGYLAIFVLPDALPPEEAIRPAQRERTIWRGSEIHARCQ